MASLPRPRPRRFLRCFPAALFSVAFLGVQAVLIATAGMRPDHAYGFWMFHESSTVELRLYRIVAVKVEGGDTFRYERIEARGGLGEWDAKDSAGVLKARSWRERVKQPELSTFGRRIPAAYGSSAVLARLRKALEDVSERTEDADTCRFEIDATVQRNGRSDGLVPLRGPWRCVGKAEP